MHYRAYFLDHESHIRHAHDLDCASDVEAQEQLSAMDRSGFAAELWRGSKLIASLPASSRTATGD